MNINTTSQYMDKQIMDLSNSQSNTTNNSDFIDFMNRPSEKKEDIVPNYDFMPIRPVVGSGSPPASRSAIFSSADDDAPLRSWNSVDAKPNGTPIRNYSSLEADEPAKFTLGKNQNHGNTLLDESLISEIDRTMKKYADNLMHGIDGLSARLSQLETRNRNLEHLVDDLKVSIGNTHGSTEGKMRHLDNILREVQTGVQDIRDKQEIMDAQLKISKLNLPKVDEVERQKTTHTDAVQSVASVPQQISTPTPQQNFQPQVQLPNQFPHNQTSSVPQQDPYFPQSGQNLETPNQQYQVPPPPPQPHHPSPQPHHHQYPPPPQNQPPSVPQQEPYFPPPAQNLENPNLQYQPPQANHPPPPQHQYPSPPQTQYSQPPPPPQQQHSLPALNLSPPQPPIGHHLEEAPYPPPQTYPPGIRQSLPHPSSATPPPHQFYGPPPNAYDAPSNRPGTGYEPYSYTGSPRKPQLSAPFTGHGGGSGYPQLPTARILPKALPTASEVGGGSGSGSGNKVPIDDVVERVTNMGFPRDQVRATVRKLTENGQAVDLNIVLDKLMTEGDTRGWYGR